MSQASAGRASAGADEATAKVESCFSTEPLPQRGQSTLSPQRRTSVSKLARQEEHTYS